METLIPNSCQPNYTIKKMLINQKLHCIFLEKHGIFKTRIHVQLVDH